MRGTHGTRHHIQSSQRIIPADAENTSPVRRGVGLKWDHPRECGEHHPVRAQSGMDAGSSPRMRGTHLLPFVHYHRHWIIPADAGNTRRIAPHRRRPRDHPRGCGEHSRNPLARPSRQGSSPRMRGTHGCPRRSKPARRIIPADAGNTGWIVKVRYLGPDHHRGCGEHSSHWMISGTL